MIHIGICAGGSGIETAILADVRQETAETARGEVLRRDPYDDASWRSRDYRGTGYARGGSWTVFW